MGEWVGAGWGGRLTQCDALALVQDTDLVGDATRVNRGGRKRCMEITSNPTEASPSETRCMTPPAAPPAVRYSKLPSIVHSKQVRKRRRRKSAS